MFLGIDKNSFVVYEGGQEWGARPLFPAPNLFSIAVAETPNEAIENLKNSDQFTGKVFREDLFDPVSMLRRGRLYQCERSGTQPAECHVAPADEIEIKEARDGNGVVLKRLFTYQGYRLSSWNRSQHLFAAIGQENARSLWRIVSCDRTYSNEDLITLRPLYYLGALPDLAVDNIPSLWQREVEDSVRKVIDSMHKAVAESIVDLCCNAGRATLCAYFIDNIDRYDKTDLTKLSNRAKKDGLFIVADSTSLLAKLHSRGKVNNQKHYKTPPISTRDAELAIQCLSVILREVNYTRADP